MAKWNLEAVQLLILGANGQNLHDGLCCLSWANAEGLLHLHMLSQSAVQPIFDALACTSPFSWPTQDL